MGVVRGKVLQKGVRNLLAGGGQGGAAGDTYVHCLDYGDSFISVYLYQNIKLDTLNVYALIYISYISVKLLIIKLISKN